MENSSLKALWDHTSGKIDPTRETEEYKTLDNKHWDILNKIKEIDWNLANDINEASNEIIAYEMYQAFVLGFREAVGLLVGCSK